MKLQDICASYHAKRAAEVALAGTHSIVFIGPHECQGADIASWVTFHGVPELPANYRSTYASPCPCGYYGSDYRECTCSIEMVGRWQTEHINPTADIYIEMLPEKPEEIIAWVTGNRRCEPQERVVKRVLEAIEFGKAHTSLALDESSTHLLKGAIEQLRLTYNQVKSIIGVARTIANLAGRDRIETCHIAEAIQYRRRR